jgi:Resolvase, N terminal domain
MLRPRLPGTAGRSWRRSRTLGISGAKGREKRSGLDKLLKAVARREVDLVAAWSVDRLGRSLQDLLGVLSEIHAKGVDLYLHQQGIDTSTPAGKALFQMLGVFAEFERAMMRERVMAGLARARREGIALGRKPLEETNAAKVKAIRAMRLRARASVALRPILALASARCCALPALSPPSPRSSESLKPSIIAVCMFMTRLELGGWQDRQVRRLGAPKDATDIHADRQGVVRGRRR